MSKEEIDLLITNGRILSENRELKGSIAIKNGEIKEVNSHKEVNSKYESIEELNAKGKIVMPGLIDGHAHNAQIMLRGSFSDKLLSLPPIWLNYLIPYESFLDPRDIEKCSLLTQLGMIKSGITSFVEAGGPCPREIAKVTIKSGLRGVISKSTIDVNSDTPMYQGTDDIVKEYEDLLKEWNGRAGNRVKVWISMRQVMLNSIDLYNELYGLADKYKTQITMHLAESRTEVSYCLEKFGKRPVEFMYDNNLLNEKVLASHMIFINDKEVIMLRKSNANIVWCPMVDAYVMGPSRVNEMREMGINIIFGSDGGAWNNLDLFEQGRQGRVSVKMLTNSLYHDKTGLDYKYTFKMLTSNGEKVLNERIGKIEEGYKADLIILDPKQNLVPMNDPIYTVVNMANSSNVDSMIVDGKLIMENKEVKTLDEDKILNESRGLEIKLKDKINDLKRNLTS